MSELKQRALSIVEIYSDLNKITEREADILCKAITIKRPQGDCENCEDKAKQYSLGFQDGYLTGKERPRGEWLKSDVPESILAKCSLCGFDCGAYTHNFCPNCGADMKGGVEE